MSANTVALGGGLYVTGSISTAGDVTAFASDHRLKANVQVIDNALDKVLCLRGVSFEWREDTPQPMRGKDVGLIAQDVKKVLPEATRLAPFDTAADGTSKSGQEYLTIDVTGNKLIALLVEAVKELSSRLESIEKRLS